VAHRREEVEGNVRRCSPTVGTDGGGRILAHGGRRRWPAWGFALAAVLWWRRRVKDSVGDEKG
jgi:hypothetical protein